MHVRVLGDIEAVVGGTVADLGGRKPRTLLALLVAAEGRPVAVEQLVDEIWGDDVPGRVEASLQSYVARLRRSLEPERGVRRPAERLRTHAGGYSLDVGDGDVDVRRFTALLRAADGGRAAGAEGLLEEALALWRGEPYAGVSTPALDADATRLRELRMTALGDLWGLRMRQGRHVEAVPQLERLVALHPLHEQLWALLARALYASSRQGDALAALRRARARLSDELGVDPGPELRRLEELVLQQDPSLDPVADLGSRTDERPAVEVAAAPPPRSGGPGLAGREEALAAAEHALAEAAAGRGRIVIVSGEPGIGKTRFTEEVTRRAESCGFRCGRGGWEAEPGPPLWGWRRATRQLSVDLAAPGDVVDAASASFRQGELLADALASGPPTLLVLDDLHWADGESLRLLRRVAGEIAHLPVVLVVACRSAAAELGEPVREALAALARRDPLRLELGGLAADDIAAWVTARTGTPISGAVAAELAARTDGNPFYVTELVRLLAAEGALGSTGAPAWRAVPLGVRDVVRQRLARLPEQSVAVLATASVVGRSFDRTVVELAAERDADQVDEALEAALMVGLVEHLEPGRYRFTHALGRDAVYEVLPPPTRERTHAAVAAALERRYAGTLLEHVVELAEHYRMAGPAHARSAWVFARRAARAAAEHSGHDAALRLYTDAGELQAVDPLVSPPEREDVLLGQALALIRLGRPIEAWPAVSRAATSALERDDVAAAAEALLTITRSSVWGWRNAGSYDDEAIALWGTVLDRLPEERQDLRALLQGGLAVELLYRPGGAERGTALAEAAVQAVRRSGAHDVLRFWVLRLAVQALVRPDLLHRRMPLFDELVGLTSALGDAAGLAAALTGRASDRVQTGRLDAAYADVLRAHEIARRHRLSQNLMVSGWCLAVWRQMEGDFEAAERATDELEAFQSTLAMAGEGIALCQRAVLRLLQGRLPELEEVLGSAAAWFPPFRELHALALVHADRAEEARRILGAWTDQPPLPWDYLWLGFVVVRAQVWCALGDEEAIGDLRDQLAPYADRFAVGSLAVTFLGSVELTLGELAAAAGDHAAAREHLARARAAHQAAGLSLWVDRTDAVLARIAAPA